MGVKFRAPLEGAPAIRKAYHSRKAKPRFVIHFDTIIRCCFILITYCIEVHNDSFLPSYSRVKKNIELTEPKRKMKAFEGMPPILT